MYLQKKNPVSQLTQLKRQPVIIYLIITATPTMAEALLPKQLPEEIVVTATRTAVPIEESLSSVTVLGREALDIQQPLDLVEVFDSVPGLDLSQSGGPGSVASLYIRGNSSDHTLFLVDGQRMGSATMGSASFQFFNPDQIERIEIVRGAHSSLYGSDAIGGVVQLFTRDGSGASGSYINASTGSNNQYQLALGTSGNTSGINGNGGWRYAANFSYLETDGIDNLVDDAGRNKDDDAYRNQSVNASLGYHFANEADISLRYLVTDTRNEYDSASRPQDDPYSEGWMQNINLHGRLPVRDFWLSTLSLGRSVDDSDNYDDVSNDNTGNFRTRRDQLFWQNDFSFAEDGVFTLAYEYYEDEVDASSRYEDQSGRQVGSRDNEALIGQLQVGLGLADVVLGLRSDDNEEFGRETTGSVSAGINIGGNYRLVGSWAEGFKAPTFNDLYWPVGPYSAGNPDLEPESSENWELALQGNYEYWRWSLTYFDNSVDSLINWAPGADSVYRPYNVDDARIKGGEFISVAQWDDWRIEASYTYVEARDDSSNALLPNRTRSNLIVSADRSLGLWQLGLSFKAQDKRYTNVDNSRFLPGYGTVDLRAQYQLSADLVLRLRVNNVLDKNYQLNQGYNQDGLGFRVGVGYTF
ncbi:MAG: TonB-dependent receptor domain-containing protein [Parahaliea sp.]